MGRAGFTMIEVLAALLVFSAGLLMMLGTSRALAQSLEHSAINTLIAADGAERMDSIMAIPFSTMNTGARTDTITYRGIRYSRAQTVTVYSPLVKRVVVTLAPLGGAVGPTYDATSYKADLW